MSTINAETVRAVAMTAPGKMEMRNYPYPQIGSRFRDSQGRDDGRVRHGQAHFQGGGL